jgi:hypothetical protein
MKNLLNISIVMFTINSMFSNDDYTEHMDLQENLDFYLSKFHDQKLEFVEMEEIQREEFKQTIKDNYYQWLGLNDEMLNHENNGSAILQSLSVYLKKQDRVNYLSSIIESIVNSFRDKEKTTIITLDKDIRQKNQELINSMEAEINHLDIGKIEAFVQMWNSQDTGARMQF